jgi:hypothetical protein
MFNSRRVKWMRHEALNGREEVYACRVFVGKPEGKRPLERPSGRIIFKWILEK